MSKSLTNKIETKPQNRFFITFFYHLFWAFLGEGSLRTPQKISANCVKIYRPWALPLRWPLTYPVDTTTESPFFGDPLPLATLALASRGAVQKQYESDVHLPLPQKQISYLLHFIFCFIFIFSLIYFYRAFGRFVTRGVKKTHLLASARRLAKGGRKKSNDESDVHLPQLQKKVVTYFILFLFLSSNVFIAFLGVSEQGEFKNAIKTFFSEKSIWAHHKKCGFFSLRFFPPPPAVVLLDFFIAFLGVS
jgi:hypothetical protein